MSEDNEKIFETFSTLWHKIKRLEKRVVILENNLKCSRCCGGGSITLRDGELDECPDCMGGGLKI